MIQTSFSVVSISPASLPMSQMLQVASWFSKYNRWVNSPKIIMHVNQIWQYFDSKNNSKATLSIEDEQVTVGSSFNGACFNFNRAVLTMHHILLIGLEHSNIYWKQHNNSYSRHLLISCKSEPTRLNKMQRSCWNLCSLLENITKFWKPNIALQFST